MIQEPKTIASFYRSALLENVIPFWETHSLDWEKSGYYSILDREGKSYSDDKYTWTQARQAWMFSALYLRLEKREAWKSIAGNGIKFLKQYGRDPEGNWYYGVKRDGSQPFGDLNVFTDCFATMALGQYYLISGDEECRVIATRTYKNILRKIYGAPNKPSAKPLHLRTMAQRMLLVNLSSELEGVLEGDIAKETSRMCIGEILNHFLDPRRNLLLEYVQHDGSRTDSPKERLVIPGHNLECMWFIMDVARKEKDQEMIEKAVDIILTTLAIGWDKKNKGIQTFLDIAHARSSEPAWDQKRWWVHAEALAALAMGFSLTGRKECWNWFKKVHDYSWKKFADPEFGEWYSSLDREGKVISEMKGSEWKSCFHLPRALWICYREFSTLHD